jgi:hypothetical protein
MVFIIILGLILVALMVYTSTRIKRSAAAAFEAETIETDEFIIQKPEGFLNVIGRDPQYLFEAYSKDFGGYKQNLRMATAKVTAANGSVDEIVKGLGGEILSDIGEVIADRHYRVIEATRTVDDVEHRVFYKLALNNGQVYRFEVDALAEADAKFLAKAEGMLASFELK